MGLGNFPHKLSACNTLPSIEEAITNIQFGPEGNDVITGRNEVVAKVIFLHLFVILFTGGGLPQCMLGYQPPQEQTPPGTRNPPGADPLEQTPPGAGTPPLGADPPRTDTLPPDQTPQSIHPQSRLPREQTPPSPRPDTPPGADPPEHTPPPQQTPPGPDTHPPGKQTPAYGLRAAGTHPTGMHSCFSNCIQKRMKVYVQPLTQIRFTSGKV